MILGTLPDIGDASLCFAKSHDVSDGFLFGGKKGDLCESCLLMSNYCYPNSCFILLLNGGGNWSVGLEPRY
jgi:hypothetical protein